jgi:hypothetical protein
VIAVPVLFNVNCWAVGVANVMFRWILNLTTCAERDKTTVPLVEVSKTATLPVAVPVLFTGAVPLDQLAPVDQVPPLAPIHVTGVWALATPVPTAASATAPHASDRMIFPTMVSPRFG